LRLDWTDLIRTTVVLLLQVEQIVDMLLLFPGGPYEITVTEIFFETLLPPVPLLENTLDDS